MSKEYVLFYKSKPADAEASRLVREAGLDCSFIGFASDDLEPEVTPVLTGRMDYVGLHAIKAHLENLEERISSLQKSIGPVEILFFSDTSEESERTKTLLDDNEVIYEERTAGIDFKPWSWSKFPYIMSKSGQRQGINKIREWIFSPNRR